MRWLPAVLLLLLCWVCSGQLAVYSGRARRALRAWALLLCVVPALCLADPDGDETGGEDSEGWQHSVDVSAQTHMTMGELQAERGRYGLEWEYDYNYAGEYDSDMFLEREFLPFLGLYVGASLERDEDGSSNVAIAGADWDMPLSMASDWRIYSDGGLRLRLRGSHWLTERLRLAWRWNTNGGHRAHLSLGIAGEIALIAGYDSDFNMGLGLEWRY